MDQQDFISELPQQSSGTQSLDKQIVPDNRGHIPSQQLDASEPPPSNFPPTHKASLLPNDAWMQNHAESTLQPRSEQSIQWKQDVDLLPGLGSADDAEIAMGQNSQL